MCALVRRLSIPQDAPPAPLLCRALRLSETCSGVRASRLVGLLAQPQRPAKQHEAPRRGRSSSRTPCRQMRPWVRLVTARFPPLPTPLPLPPPQHSSVGIPRQRGWATGAVGGRGRGSRCELAKEDRTSHRPRSRAQNPRPTQGPGAAFSAARETGSPALGKTTVFAACPPCAVRQLPEPDSLSCPLTPLPDSCIHRFSYSLL